MWFRRKQRKRWRWKGDDAGLVQVVGRVTGSWWSFALPPPTSCCAAWGWRGEGYWGGSGEPLLHHKPVVMWRRCGVGEAFSSQVIRSPPLVSLGFWTVNFTRVSRVFPQELCISLPRSHLCSDTQQVRFWLTSFPCGQAFKKSKVLWDTSKWPPFPFPMLEAGEDFSPMFSEGIELGSWR